MNLEVPLHAKYSLQPLTKSIDKEPGVPLHAKYSLQPGT